MINETRLKIKKVQLLCNMYPKRVILTIFKNKNKIHFLKNIYYETFKYIP